MTQPCLLIRLNTKCTKIEIDRKIEDLTCLRGNILSEVQNAVKNWKCTLSLHNCYENSTLNLRRNALMPFKYPCIFSSTYLIISSLRQISAAVNCVLLCWARALLRHPCTHKPTSTPLTNLELVACNTIVPFFCYMLFYFKADTLWQNAFELHTKFLNAFDKKKNKLKVF